MARPQRYALIRALTLFCLLWTGIDLGAHGIFPSDFQPIENSSASVPLRVGARGVDAPNAPDHCFCHGVSMGAVLSAPSAGLTPVGTLVSVLCPEVPPSHPHPLDKPPQFLA
jgi:hypothetical protein